MDMWEPYVQSVLAIVRAGRSDEDLFDKFGDGLRGAAACATRGTTCWPAPSTTAAPGNAPDAAARA